MPVHFGNAEEAKVWVDNWVERTQSISVFPGIADYEDRHQEKFGRDFGQLGSQFEIQYSSLVGLLDQINGLDKTTWPLHRPVQFILISYNLKPLISAMDRLSKGFYEDAVTLIRSAYETFLRTLFISCHKDHPYSCLVNRPPAGEPVFNVTNFVRDELRVDWLTNYSIMSVFAHSNVHQTTEAVIRAAQRVDEPEVQGLQFEYREDLAALAGVFLQFLVFAYLRVAIERLVGPLTPPDVRQFDTAVEAKDFLAYIFHNHPKEYWRSLADDLDFIFDLLEVADRGDDWHEFARVR